MLNKKATEILPKINNFLFLITALRLKNYFIYFFAKLLLTKSFFSAILHAWFSLLNIFIGNVYEFNFNTKAT